MSKLILGIDISKDKFDVALLVTDRDKLNTKKFTNNSAGFLQLLDWLKHAQINELHVCMEATGNYGEALATFLYNQGFIVSVVNPAQIKGFAKSELSRTKTDKTDCKLIARFCKAMQPKAWQPALQHIKELQDLVHRLEDLKDIQQQEKNRLHVASEQIKPCIEKIINFLETEIIIIKQKITDCINQESELYNKNQLLETIPGIGKDTAAKILAFISNKEFKNAKQLTAFVGLNPKHRQSGSSLKGKSYISRIGSSTLRKTFYFPAIVAKRYNPIIKDFCERLRLAGKPSMVIIIAAMRKLLHIIYGVLKNGKAFNASLAK